MKKEFKQSCIGMGRQIRIALDKDYLSKKLSKRSGKCRKCGRCCGSCIFLDKKTKLCTIYESRPKILCYKDFPLDKSDQKLWGVEKTCGYKFSKG